MKKLFSIALVLVMLLSCAAALAEAPITLTYAEVNPVEGTVVGDVALAFKEKLEELSGGEILVDIRESGVLGSENEVLSGIMAGDTTVDIVRISAFALNQYGAQKSVFLTLPYIFTTEDQYWTFLESDLAKDFLAEAKEVGLPLTGLAYGEEGFRHFFFTKEVTDMEGIKGLKIRVSQDPIMVGLVESLGASATSINFGELYSNLDSGTVDGAEQPITNYLKNSFHQPAPYLLLNGHTLGTIELIATDSCFAKLSEEQQAMVQEAADYAMGVCKEKVVSRQEEALETLKNEGCTVIEVEDKTPWREATKGVVEANIAGMEDIYQQILDMQ